MSRAELQYTGEARVCHQTELEHITVYACKTRRTSEMLLFSITTFNKKGSLGKNSRRRCRKMQQSTLFLKTKFKTYAVIYTSYRLYRTAFHQHHRIHGLPKHSDPPSRHTTDKLSIIIHGCYPDLRLYDPKSDTATN